MARQLIFYCVTLLAVQSTFAFVDIQGLLQTEAERVQNLTQKAINDVERAVITIQEQVDKAVQAEVQKIEAWVDDFKQKVTAKVQATSVQNRASTQTSTECVRAVPKQLQDTAEQILKDAIACITKPIKDAKTIIEDLVVQAKLVNETVANLSAKLVGCHQNTGIVSIALCKMDALGIAGMSITGISIKITVDITRAVALVTGLQADFTACELAVLTKIPLQAATILGDFTKCVGDVILG